MAGGLTSVDRVVKRGVRDVEGILYKVTIVGFKEEKQDL